MQPVGGSSSSSAKSALSLGETSNSKSTLSRKTGAVHGLVQAARSDVKSGVIAQQASFLEVVTRALEHSVDEHERSKSIQLNQGAEVSASLEAWESSKNFSSRRGGVVA